MANTEHALDSDDCSVEILVVEDDPDTALLVTKVLQRHKWIPRTASSAEQALELLTSKRFAAVLLDYLLQNQASWSVLQAACAQYPPIPVVMVTGSGSEAIAVEALRKGAADYIIKDGTYWKTLPDTIAHTIRTRTVVEARDFLQPAEVSDGEFLHQLRPLNEISTEQIDTARRIRADDACLGLDDSIAGILVRQSFITTTLRNEIEQHILAGRRGGVRQLGQYRLIKKIGEGGMGVVYLAKDLQSGRRVALKVLSKTLSGVNFVRRFRRESSITERLRHPNIVSSEGAGCDQGYHYMVMEYCVGETLEAKLDREYLLNWRKAVDFAIHVARGLDYAHMHGIVHRDVKPGNIFFSCEGVKILDLGLSKEINSNMSFSTQSGVALGTPQYLSPEQARGAREIDGRADIYALGVTLFHALTGRAPFEGPTVGVVMLKHLSENLPDPQELNRSIPNNVAHIIKRATEKDPAHRYQNCRQMLRDLEATLHVESPVDEEMELSSVSGIDTHPIHECSTWNLG